jgi:HSP20 family molecular chaperone IbpA
LARKGSYSLDIEDWLEAEKEILCKPAVTLIEKPDVFVIRAALGGIDPSSIDVLATSEDVLIQSKDDNVEPRIFRAVHLPANIAPLQMHGTYVRRTLVLIAPKLLIPTRRAKGSASRTTSNSPAPLSRL